MGMIKRGSLILLSLVLVLTGLFIGIAPADKASADTLGSFTRYATANGNMNSASMVTGPDGNLWYTMENQTKVAKVTTSGTVTSYTLPGTYYYPQNMINGPGGSLWFTVRRSSSSLTNLYTLVKMSTSGSMTYYDLPTPTDRPSSLSDVSSMVSTNGYIWVGRGYSRYIQKVTPTGVTSNVLLTIPSAVNEVNWQFYAPYVTHQLEVDPNDGSLWVSARNRSPGNTTLGHYIENIKMNDDRQLFELPYDSSDFHAMQDLIADGQGKIWFIGSATGDYGYMTTDGTSEAIFDLPTGYSPYKFTLGMDGNLWMGETNNSLGKIAKIDPATGALSAEYSMPALYGYRPSAIATGTDTNIWFVDYGSNTVAKVGAGSITPGDSDGDGLTLAQELQQGTSDSADDSDGDGLSDLLESQWFSDRNDVFCNSSTSYCEYPDPSQKDLYVETDWMVKPGPGGYSMQPTSTHIDALKDAFTDQGLKAHIDSGQLGGGNEVPYYSDVFFQPNVLIDYDFYDYKNGNGIVSAQFDSATRYGVWRYMLIVQQVEASTTTGGISYPGDDDSMIAYETLQTAYGVNFDAAFASTMLHELGHNICLTDDDPSHTYTGQSASCVFEGIDHVYSTDYQSAMNYSLPYLVDFSYGTNVANDHNDWNGVAVGFDDFTLQQVGDGVAHSTIAGKKVKKDPGRILKDYRKSNKKNLTPNDYRKPIID